MLSLRRVCHCRNHSISWRKTVLCLVTLQCFFVFTYLFKIKYFHDLEFSKSYYFVSHSMKVPSFYTSPSTGPRCPECSRKLSFPYGEVNSVKNTTIKKLHVSAYSGRLQVLTTFLLKEFYIISLNRVVMLRSHHHFTFTCSFFPLLINTII